MNKVLISFLLVAWTLSFASCSSSYKTQGYARLSQSKDFEDDYPIVWSGIMGALGDYKVEEKDQEKGRVKTDWVYSTSTEKYVEYKVNGFPRKKYLQTRYKYVINADRQIEHVKVTVNLQEEIEDLKSDGSFDGWKSVSQPDGARANDMIRAIETKILSRHA